MLAAVYHSNEDVRLEEMEIPRIGPDELLVKVLASGICGSDVMEWYRLPKAPLVLGHEIAGEIAETGRDVKGYARGDRVVVSHHVPCDSCRYCLSGNQTACRTLHTTNFDPGGFAQYVRVPRINVEKGVLRLPPDVSWEEGTFVEPLGCVLRAQERAEVGPGKTVLVIGSGISGLLHLKLAAALGAGRTFASDIADFRLEAARAAGADVTAHAEEDVARIVRESNEGLGADVVIVCAAASSAISLAFESVEDAGTIVLFAPPQPGALVETPLGDLWQKQASILTSYAAAPSELAGALDLIRTRRVTVSDLITHRLPLSRAQEGFRLVAEAGKSLKVILEPFAEASSAQSS